MAHGLVTTNVPAELKSAVVNGVVTSAEGVFDYVIQKSQETINQELYEAVQEAGTATGDYYPD
jgi:hypothetical protein